MSNRICYILSIMLAITACDVSSVHVRSDLRAPAYPLITIDPYTSAWSPADNLYDANVIHWTEREFPFMGVLRVDGQAYRFMGIEHDRTLVPVHPMAKDKAWKASYTFEAPSEGWQDPDYDYSSWKVSEAPFGMDHSEVNTIWDTEEMWMRVRVEVEDLAETQDITYLYYTHDGMMQLYINGEEVVSTGNTWKENARVELTKEQLARWGDTLDIAAHCKWFSDARYIDFGIYHNLMSEKTVPVSAEQVSADAQATRTIYTFRCGGVDMKLTFMAPLLMDDPDLLSRPVNYISYELDSNDGAEHEVQFYVEAGQDWARNDDSQVCENTISADDRLTYAKCGNVEQPVLEKNGDDIRIDWGYFYLAGDKDKYETASGNPDVLRGRFLREGKVYGNGEGALAMASKLIKVSRKPVSDFIMVGYDDICSILYYGQPIRPYWNRKGDSTIEAQFVLAADQYGSVCRRCEEFDSRLMHEAYEAGGKEYAELCALAYRQSVSAHKLIETPKGEMAWLSKENFSNGSIGTVDVTYPSFPLYLHYNTDFAKGLLNFIFELCESELWNEDYAPHDAGIYPHVFGQRYDGGMPVEESGNMLIMTGAICRKEGSPEYALKYWDLLGTWAEYLSVNGGDPGNQLCTDDFMGHSARNANLSIKAILGVAAYADMAGMAGKDEIADKYYARAKEMAAAWKEMAEEGDHYRLTFDKGKDTWSQKYNLVWDEIMGYGVFDEDIAEREVAYYLTKMDRYGLPLDCRNTCTKCDWVVWSATMADDDETFRKFIEPMYDFYNVTNGRVPMPDLYHVNSASHATGWLQARSVVGAFWIRMLSIPDQS